MSTKHYQSEERVITELVERPRYYLEVIEGGEWTTEDHPVMVWQIDLDEQHKPWNATPCMGFAEVSAAIEYVKSGALT